MHLIKKFNELSLHPAVLSVLNKIGYENPTPIQMRSIPILMKNQDLLAQAQTGTGKTAAFALPILSNLDIELRETQALIIVPTRELAVQVSEAFAKYAKYMKGVNIVPIYGGQEYRTQLRSLKNFRALGASRRAINVRYSKCMRGFHEAK